MDAAQAYPMTGNAPTAAERIDAHAGRMLLHDWPAQERPRERLLAGGPAQLSDAELLAIFLGSGLRGQDAVATARDLLARHGPLRELLERGPVELMKLPGLGPARACRLSAALELCNRYLAAGLERGEALSDPHAAGRYFAQRLRGQPQEVFACLFLDARHRALAFEELFHGTVDGAEVHPREVVRRALAHNAAAVIAGLIGTLPSLRVRLPRGLFALPLALCLLPVASALAAADPWLLAAFLGLLAFAAPAMARP